MPQDPHRGFTSLTSQVCIPIALNPLNLTLELDEIHILFLDILEKSKGDRGRQRETARGSEQ